MALQRAREFSSESIGISAGKLFCRACREELFLKQSSIQTHVTSSKHTAGKEKLAKKEKRDMSGGIGRNTAYLTGQFQFEK